MRRRSAEGRRPNRRPTTVEGRSSTLGRLARRATGRAVACRATRAQSDAHAQERQTKNKQSRVEANFLPLLLSPFMHLSLYSSCHCFCLFLPSPIFVAVPVLYDARAATTETGAAGRTGATTRPTCQSSRAYSEQTLSHCGGRRVQTGAPAETHPQVVAWCDMTRELQLGRLRAQTKAHEETAVTWRPPFVGRLACANLRNCRCRVRLRGRPGGWAPGLAGGRMASCGTG